MSVSVISAAPPRPPLYYVRQRLLHNWPAMVGLVIIAVATAVAILGYAIMPDNSPNANDGIVQLQKKPPGFTVKVLRVQKPTPPPQISPALVWLVGQPTLYQEIPIERIEVKGEQVVVYPYRSNNTLADQQRTFSVSEIIGNPEKEADLRKSLEKRSAEELIRAEFVDTRTFLLGTDKAGRDVLSRLLLGTRISLGIGFVAVLISLGIGLFAGAVAGYFGGRTDKFIMFLMTVVWSVPGIMLVIAISLALNSKGVWVAFVAVGLTMWVDVARVVRGQVLSLREKTYIEAANVLGIPQMRIIRLHLLPNMLGPLIVIATANFAAAILMEAGLSFLGLGVQPPAPSWGMMVNEGFQLIGARSGIHLVLLPSICISILVLAFNLLGNGLRDAYDPKTPLSHA